MLALQEVSGVGIGWSFGLSPLGFLLLRRLDGALLQCRCCIPLFGGILVRSFALLPSCCPSAGLTWMAPLPCGGLRSR